MTVHECIRMLQHFDPDLEMVSLADELVCYFEATPPKVKILRLRHCDILNADRWQDSEFVDIEEMIAEKTVVCI